MELDSLTELCLDVLFPSVSPITSASTIRVLSLEGLLARISPRPTGVGPWGTGCFSCLKLHSHGSDTEETMLSAPNQ